MSRIFVRTCPSSSPIQPPEKKTEVQRSKKVNETIYRLHVADKLPSLTYFFNILQCTILNTSKYMYK